MIQKNQAFTGLAYDPGLLHYDSFMEKSLYAAKIGKPMYLFINGSNKYPVNKIGKIIRLPWRKVWIVTELPFDDKKARYHEGEGWVCRDVNNKNHYDNEIIKDLNFYYLVKGL